MTERNNTLLIGCGYWGIKWANTLKLENKLGAICETDPARRRQVFEDLQATANEPEQARAFLRDSAMLNALRREREIP